MAASVGCAAREGDSGWQHSSEEQQLWGAGGLPHPCPEYGALRHGTRTAILLAKAGSPAGARDAKERDRRGMI